MDVAAVRSFSFFFAYLLLGSAAAMTFGAGRSAAQGRDPKIYSVPVVVSDFELYSAPPRTMRNAKPDQPPTKPKTKPDVPLIYQDTDAPLDQANRLVDYFAMTLVQTLRSSGFQTATRGRTLPAGAQIRGVFAEPDALNRIRRSILGAGSPNGKFLLYVGVFNLGKPHQPLYDLATEQPQNPEYGPVITLNNYVPLAKYELDKNPTEEDVRKICNQIAESLQTLLASNPMAFTQ